MFNVTTRESTILTRPNLLLRILGGAETCNFLATITRSYRRGLDAEDRRRSILYTNSHMEALIEGVADTVFEHNFPLDWPTKTLAPAVEELVETLSVDVYDDLNSLNLADRIIADICQKGDGRLLLDAVDGYWRTAKLDFWLGSPEGLLAKYLFFSSPKHFRGHLLPVRETLAEVIKVMAQNRNFGILNHKRQENRRNLSRH